MNNDVFAKSLKIDPGQLSGVKTGKYNLTIPQLLEVNSIYGVRLGWLLEGEKPMFKNEKSGTNKMPDRSLLVQLNNELSAAQLSLRKLEESLAFPQEENVNQGAAYQEIPVNKNPIADKQ